MSIVLREGARHANALGLITSCGTLGGLRGRAGLLVRTTHAEESETTLLTCRRLVRLAADIARHACAGSQGCSSSGSNKYCANKETIFLHKFPLC